MAQQIKSLQMATFKMSSEIESDRKTLEPIVPSVDKPDDWQQCLDIWETEAEQVKLRKASVEIIASLLNILCEMLRRLTRKSADLLNADRASIFLLDQPRKALASIIAEDGEGGSLVIDIPSDAGFAGLAASSSSVINIPFDVYDDPRSLEAKNTDKKTSYRTYTLLVWPLFNEQKNIVAIVQFVNKLKLNCDAADDLSKRIDTNGFTQKDEALFAKFAPSILQTIKRCHDCYGLTQKIRENKAVVMDGVVLQDAELIALLKRKEQQMREILDKI